MQPLKSRRLNPGNSYNGYGNWNRKNGNELVIGKKFNFWKKGKKKLQAYESVLGDTGNLSIVTKKGFVWLLNKYLLGNGNTNRHGTRSITRGVLFRLVFSAVDAFWTGHYRVKINLFLVYDREPTDTVPVYTDIFNSAYDASSKMVKLTANERFFIQRRWEVNMSSNSVTVGKSLPSSVVGAPSQNKIEFNKYVKTLAVTDWKDSPTAEITDMKKGALYFVAVSDWDDQTVLVGMRGTYRSYFSSY